MARMAKAHGRGDRPRIYVASLADYNAGRLHGVWLDALDHDEVQAGVEKMLKASREPGAEEFAIHDFEGFGSYRIHEYESLALVCAIGAAVVEHGILFAEYLAHVGDPKHEGDVAHALETFQEYQGEFRVPRDWAEQFLEDTGSLKDVPESLRNYIEFEKWADDAELNGDAFTIEDPGAVHVFWGS